MGVNNETNEIMKSVEDNIDNFTDISEDNPVIVVVFDKDPAVLAKSVEALEAESVSVEAVDVESMSVEA